MAVAPGNLTRWLDRQSRREARRVSLEDVVVFGALWRYLWQRSRRFALTRTVQELLHVVELYLLFLFASQGEFITVAVAGTLARVAGGAWWGALEMLRTGVRERARDGRFIAIPPWIRDWVIISTFVGFAVCAIGIGFFWLRLTTGELGVAEAYFGVRIFGFGLDLPTRAFHSGAYAFQRVYRPTWSLLVPSALHAIVLLSLWHVFGVWSIPVASLLGMLVSFASTVWFTRLTYVGLGIWPLYREARARRPTRLSLGGVQQFVVAALANASTGIVQVWTLALLSFRWNNSDLWLGLLIYLVVAGPLFDACLAWARLFYPDLMRLESNLTHQFRVHLVRGLMRASLIVGTCAWISALFVLVLVPGDAMLGIALVTWIFFIVRARFAAIQVIAFCHRSYAMLSLLSLALLLAAAGAYLAPQAEPVWLIAGMVVCVIPLWSDTTGRSAPTGLVPVASLIAGARWIEGEGKWSLSEFRPGWLLHGPQALLHRSARQTGAIGINRESLLLRWMPAVPQQNGFDVVHDFERRRWNSPKGEAVASIAVWSSRWPAGSLPNPVHRKGVIAEFRARFEDGLWLDVGEAPNRDVRKLLTWRERKRVLEEAVRHVFGRQPAALLPLDISALVEDGRIVVIFFLPRTTSSVARRHWRRWLREVGIANALADARATALERRGRYGWGSATCNAVSQASNIASAVR